MPGSGFDAFRVAAVVGPKRCAASAGVAISCYGDTTDAPVDCHTCARSCVSNAHGHSETSL